MKPNIDSKVRSSKKELLLVFSQFIIIALHFFKVNLFNQKLFHVELLIINYISNFLIFIALIFIIISVKKLGKSISPMPKPKENSKLVTSGIYRIFRHPMYYSLILISLGLLLKSLTCFNLILTILLIFIISIKIKIEEEYLSRKFIDYKLYKEEVKI